MKTKRILAALTLIMAVFVLASFTVPFSGSGPWTIPAKYKSMKNPNAGDENLTKTVGKALWAKHCKSCHGNLGLGDGPKAPGLKTPMDKFNEAAFQAGTDGEIYYKSIIGRDEMPNFEGKIPDEEGRWAVVNYIRTLK
jgi:mono/diheme cytochrome c family protein